ncbi:MAG TPA: CDP-alcohol phosphatidyltransferase family protein [Actinomycetes bacterium]
MGGWLRLMYAVARPFAVAGVPPDAVTLLGLVAAGAVAALAWAGAGWLLLAALVVVLSGVLDGVDGAVAVLTDRTTAFGFVLDSLVDRCSDLLYLLALYLAGAPAWVCVAAGVVTLLHEYARARAAAGGLPDVGMITVAERPTRVIVTALALALAAAAAADGGAGPWAQGGAVVWLVLGVVGLVQLLVVLGRRLR